MTFHGDPDEYVLTWNTTGQNIERYVNMEIYN